MAGSSRLRHVGTMPAPIPDMKNRTCRSGRAAHHGMVPRNPSTSSITTPMRLSLYLAAKL
eukprot:scaffold121654_cov42-Phaeocystis_antarctica.AAC.1